MQYLRVMLRHQTWHTTASALLLLMTASAGFADAAQPDARRSRIAAPVNPNATPEARALLAFLYRISGKHILLGQHNPPSNIAKRTEQAYQMTGKYPAVFGQDFGYSKEGTLDDITLRPAIVEEIKRQHRLGSIITMTWHALRPIDDEPVTWKESVQAQITDEQWTELITPGTPLYKKWCGQVDVIAGYLKQLQEARIPILWRPYHESGGSWFWWNGRKGERGFVALYRQLFDRFVNHHKLNNLLWVWNSAEPRDKEPNLAGPYEEHFPGLDYCDVLSVDIYFGFVQSHHDDLVRLAAGKPVALGEVGRMPTPETLDAQPQWTWFLTWSGSLVRSNKPELVRAVYNYPRALSREDLKGSLRP